MSGVVVCELGGTMGVCVCVCVCVCTEVVWREGCSEADWLRVEDGPQAEGDMDCGLEGSSVYRISQARIVEGVAISCSRDLPIQVKPTSLASPTWACRFFTTAPTWEG